MTECEHCGNQNLSSAGFCDECGLRLNGATAQVEHTVAPPNPPSFLREDLQPNPVRPLSPIGKLFLDSEEANEALANVARLIDRKSTRLNSSHSRRSRMPSCA